MRPLWLLAVCFIVACHTQVAANPPPSDAFYWPTGLSFWPDPNDADGGLLFVANANFDRRYDQGSLMAIDVEKLGANGQGLAPFPAPKPIPVRGVPGGIANIFALNLPADGSRQQTIESFASTFLGTRPQASGALRLVIPTRAENDRLTVIDAARSGALSCVFPGTTPSDCVTRSPSLIENQFSSTQSLTTYRAPDLIGVGIAPDDGEIWLSHDELADSPLGSGTDFNAFLVHPPGSVDDFAPGPDGTMHITDPNDFINIGPDPGDHVAVGARYVYTTGRYIAPEGSLLRMVDRTGVVAPLFPAVESDFRSLEARGLLLTFDPISGLENRLFMVTRSPDNLIVLNITDPTADSPSMEIAHNVSLPSGAVELVLIARPGKGPLVIMPSTNIVANVTGSESTLGTISVYDDDLGAIVGSVPSLGTQPTGLAVQNFGVGIRIFVSMFGDGSIAVIDMPDVNQPHNLYTWAYLGRSIQVCDFGSQDPAQCTETQ